MRLLLLIVGLAAILLSTGCVNKYAGEGPVKMSPQAARNFEAYSKDDRRMYFMLSEDGKETYYYYCRDNRCIFEQPKMIAECNEIHNISSCRMFANKYELIWQDAGEFMPFRSEAVKEAFGTYFQ